MVQSGDRECWCKLCKKKDKLSVRLRMSSYWRRQNQYIQRIWGRLTSRSGTTQISPAPMEQVQRHEMSLLHEACARLLKTIQLDKERQKKWKEDF
ncbi:hypothetical protein L5515_006265 [Caenorhabditis briggsae]|uniref:Uncharacterized protein n=1 Tax=Caenorhabditis briggsae TaxID=6238 RepID=A0AAE9F085_CAEBR|nr:hypothetical protein L5515_006265 [Caenorhabditis briggsae]